MAIATLEREVTVARQPCTLLELTTCRCLASECSLPINYKMLFAMGWRYHPNKEGLLVPMELDLNAYTLANSGFNPKGYHLAIYCQVSGVRLGSNNMPFAVKSPDGKEALRVCKEVKEWLLSEYSWTAV